ncbi:MAG: aminotransferase class V-fold PLP-dependent enzyme [Candidatus Shikimatogenerans bostrichidophilus]|nr:MAG: aminotransferase class V-fold PLP-dependent enzyme [Candidatus Shikimatogenerans bostrichidophilus]
MRRIYLDNASNTKMRKIIIKIYKNLLYDKNISNPSSFHFLGRYSKYYIEKSREGISNLIKCKFSEIIFTSSGTEGNYIIISGAIKNYKIKYIITSRLEHLSVLNTLELFKEKIKIFYIDNDEFGNLNLNQLELILKNKTNYKYNILVSIMAINNEIGNINNIELIGLLCKKYYSLFHSDFIQYIGHYNVNMKKIYCHYFTASAHKFYGPLGIGFIYIKKGFEFKKSINIGILRNKIISDTDNLYGIVCVYYALKIFYKKYKKEKNKILKLKKYAIKLLNNKVKNIKYNGLSGDINRSSYNILNIRLPVKDDLLHVKLDLINIIVSIGSSCYSNKNKSYVLKYILRRNIYKNTTSLRISLGIYNKRKDIYIFVNKLKKLLLW